MINEKAIVHSSAKIADNVEVGPWTLIGENVVIDEHTIIGPHVVIHSNTKIGKHNHIYQFASIGEDPQDKKYAGEATWLHIGDHNIIREFCTLNRGTEQGCGKTIIGNHNLLMAYVHIAHDCHVYDHTIFANYAALAGHVNVHDHTIMGGYSGVHQFCTVGAHAFIAMGSHVTKDVLPFVMVGGCEPKTHGLNIEGLRRRNFSSDKINFLKQAYKIIFRNTLTVNEAIQELESLVPMCEEIALMITSLKQSTRGIVR